MNKLTKFRLYKNTPLTDLVNTIYFKSNEERDKFFIEQYEYIEYERQFNFIRDRFTLRLEGRYEDFKDINYCSFLSEFEDIRYYCFIPEYKYINDSVIELKLMVDPVMTFCQGDTLNELQGIKVTRQHLTNKDYEKNLMSLKNNDDVIKTHTKKYFFNQVEEFTGFNILIHSNVDLSSPFGTKDNPTIETSTGTTFDNISSPVDLYLISEDKFNSVMKKLQSYPWITQNFVKIVQIPKELLNISSSNLKTEPVNNKQVDLKDVFKITGGSSKYHNIFLEKLNKTNDTLLNYFGLTNEDRHLLRNEYTTIELYNWNGQQLFIDTGQLHQDLGLTLDYVGVGGYYNEMGIYVKGYKSYNKENSSFLNDALFFKDFDDVPILIDNYTLALSKSANKRELAESNLLSGKVKRMFSRENNLQDRLVSSVSILSNISPMKVGQGLVDEHEYYRQQQAEFKDLALDSPTITNQSTTNSLGRNNNFYGITLKMSKPDFEEMNKIKKYYKLYGYEINNSSTKLSDTRSMSICNYLQFEGNYNIKNMERSMLDILKVQFENGVRLWHNKNIPNPFTQDILKNERVK